MVIVEKLVEWKLAGETEAIGENLPERHFCPSQNPTWLEPGLNPGRRGGDAATNHLSYGAARCSVSEQNYFLQDRVVSPMPNPHPWGPGCLLLFWTLTFDLTGMTGAAGS
jgi:hypothetical protein